MRAALRNIFSGAFLALALTGALSSCGGITAPGTPWGSGAWSCDPGYCLNYFSGQDYGVCCKDDHPYYCDGTNGCYATWEGAYYGHDCTMPTERRCY